MIASLPMYDRPETVAANDRLWSGVVRVLDREGVAAPDRLDRDIGLWEAWTSPDLLLSQTCGLPFRTRLHTTVTLVSTPVYDLADVPPGHYKSVLVARRGDPRRALPDFAGATLACNDLLSQSGWAAPMTEAAAAGIAFGAMRMTGGHRRSADAVAEGSADLAAIDALTWAMIRRWDASATALREIGSTTPTPGLPWITASAGVAPLIADALDEALANLPAGDRALLGIAGATRLGPEAYLAVPVPPSHSAERP
jgi:ABC-type phosphate/phosphonate transport system substrate-binding protein